MKISNDDVTINIKTPSIPKVNESSADFDNYSHDPLNDKKEDSNNRRAMEIKEKIKIGEYEIDIGKLSSILLKNL